MRRRGGGLGVAAKSVLLVGVGKRRDVTTDSLRRALGRVAPQLAKRRTVATTFPQVVGRSPEDAVQATVEGLLLGAYRFDRYKSGKNEDHPEKPALRTVTVLGSPRWTGRAVVRSLEESIARGDIVSDAVAWARDLVNTPAGDLTPEDLAGHAAQMAKEVGLECKVYMVRAGLFSDVDVAVSWHPGDRNEASPTSSTRSHPSATTSPAKSRSASSRSCGI